MRTHPRAACMLTRPRALRYAPCMHTAAEGAQDNMHDAWFHVHAFADASAPAACFRKRMCARSGLQNASASDRSCTRMQALTLHACMRAHARGACMRTRRCALYTMLHACTCDLREHELLAVLLCTWLCCCVQCHTWPLCQFLSVALCFCIQHRKSQHSEAGGVDHPLKMKHNHVYVHTRPA